MHAKSLELCSTLCDPMACSPPGSSLHGILQARTLARDLPHPGSEPASLMSPALAGRFFTPMPSGKPAEACRQHQINSQKGENNFSWAVERGSQI